MRATRPKSRYAFEYSLNDTDCYVIKGLNGHGIGTELHTEMTVYTYDYFPEEQDAILEPGMIFTIEPIVMQGKGKIKKDPDSTALLAEPPNLTAQFEHTVLVTDSGCEILTESPRGIYVPQQIRARVEGRGWGV